MVTLVRSPALVLFNFSPLEIQSTARESHRVNTRVSVHVSVHTLTFQHYPVTHPATPTQISTYFRGGRQKVKLIILPAAEKTIQRHFADPQGTDGTKMANVKQSQQMIPLVTCKIPYCQDVCELVVSVNECDLDFGVQINSIEQPIKSNSLLSFIQLTLIFPSHTQAHHFVDGFGTQPSSTMTMKALTEGCPTTDSQLALWAREMRS